MSNLMQRDNLEGYINNQSLQDPSIYNDLLYIEKNIDTFSTALYKVYQTVIPDTSQLRIFTNAIQGNLYSITEQLNYSLYTALDTNTTWVKKLVNNQFPTGQPYIDSLNSYFGLTIVSSSYIYNTGIPVFQIQLTHFPNIVAMDSLAKFYNLSFGSSFPHGLMPPITTDFCGIYWDGIKYYNVDALGVHLIFENSHCVHPTNIPIDTLEATVDYACNSAVTLIVLNSSLNLQDVKFDYTLSENSVSLKWYQDISSAVSIERYNYQTNKTESIFKSVNGLSGKFADHGLTSGMYKYFLYAYPGSNKELLGEVDVKIETLSTVNISQTRNHLTINSTENISSLDIFDIQGRCVKSIGTSSNSVEINTDLLSNGVYIIKVNNESYKWYKQ